MLKRNLVQNESNMTAAPLETGHEFKCFQIKERVLFRLRNANILVFFTIY
jgi:hypothetical protein